MNFVSVYAEPDAINILWELLKERVPNESISHKGMPTYNDHIDFVISMPYFKWYLIRCPASFNANFYAGSIYLTKQREIGIFIFKKDRGRGFGKQAIKELMKLHPGKFLANINPKNKRSIKLFSDLKFKHVQNTYELS